VDAALEARIEKAARHERMHPSEFVRDSVERRLGNRKRRKRESVYNVALRTGFLGAASGLPSDLSTNKKYFEGFGT
jgi:hypothetical protein